MERDAGSRSTHQSRSPLPSSSSNPRTSRVSSRPGSEPMASSGVTSRRPRMDAELVDLASSRPEILMRFMDSQGVESFSDLRGIWGSSMEFVSEIESFAGQALPADEAMGLATFWALASKRAHDGHRRLVDSLVSERSSSYRSSVRLHEAPQVPPKNCRKAEAGVYRCSRVKRPSFILTKTLPKKLFIAPCFIFSIFYVSSSFIMYLHNPKLFVETYPLIFV